MHNTPGYVLGILPPASEWEWRGTQAFHPKTGSSVSAAISYCKDIRGCGAKDYRNVSAVITLNYLDECVPRLNGVISISGLFYNSATKTEVQAMLDALMGGSIGGSEILQDGTSFLEAHSNTCAVA